MMNQQHPPETPDGRTLLDRVLNPTPKDVMVIRIFFWISILICLLLPRYVHSLENDPAWRVISIVWLGLAIGVRILVYIRAKA